MFRFDEKDSVMQDRRFIAVESPSRTEGVGRALQAAFRDGLELPADMRNCLNRLDRVRL